MNYSQMLLHGQVLSSMDGCVDSDGALALHYAGAVLTRAVHAATLVPRGKLHDFASPSRTSIICIEGYY